MAHSTKYKIWSDFGLTDKPKKFKCVCRNVYSCLVNISYYGQSGPELVDKIEAKFKQKSRDELHDDTIDYILDEVGYENYENHDEGVFKRDGGYFKFITDIRINDIEKYEEYRKKKDRIKKMKTIM